MTDPLAPLRFWRDVASRYDGVVVVLPRGRVDAAELREVRGILRTAKIAPLAVVLSGRLRRASGRSGETFTPAAAPLPSLPTELRPTVTTNGVPVGVAVSNGSRPDGPDTEHKGTADQRRGR